MTEQVEQLLSLFLQDSSAMTDEQTRELSRWVLQDAKNTKEFIHASLFHRSIHDILRSSDEGRNLILQEDVNAGSSHKQLWDMLVRWETAAPEVEIEKSAAPEKKAIQKEVSREKNKTSFTTFLPAIISAAAVISLIIYVVLVPNKANVEVATLADSLNAQWAESPAPTNKTSRLMTNHAPLMLRKGYAEIVFDNNSRAMLEAPAEFQVLSSDQIKLNYGRLYVTVPKSVLGFVVETPESKIVDLGTEFGVQADIDGATELHVVKGKTSLVSGPKGNETSVLVNAGFAKRVILNSLESLDIACDTKMFVRQIDSKKQFVWRGQNVNLADIIGGGNGFGTGQLDWGIDASTGYSIQSLPILDAYSGPKGYVRAASNPFIDGIFVAGIHEGLTQIASTGVQTGELPKTSGQIWGYIFNGAWHEGTDTPRHNLQLNGVTLDGKKNPAITMHSNLGITFNLSAIRNSLPGVRIKSFSSLFGVSQTAEEIIKLRDFSKFTQMPGIEKLSAERRSTAELWVFLDGKKVLRQKVSSGLKASNIYIPIDGDVQFLTLAVTEADDTFMFDWTVFSQPELILESAEQINTKQKVE